MYIFLESDPFTKIMQGRTDAALLGDLFNSPKKKVPIRRPYRGVQIKEDRYSTLTVKTAEGTSIKLTSSSAFSRDQKGMGEVEEYADFILQSLEDQRMEKQQIIETFGEPYIYFFGERPRIVTMRGLLINTEDFNWRSQFWDNYDKHLRGTKLVQANARAYLSFDTMVIEGYPLSANAVDDSGEPYSVPFAMTMLVTAFFDYSEIGETRFPDYGYQPKLTDINYELEERRSKYVSTGAQVRIKNLLAQPSGGLLGTLRSGIREINEVMSGIGTLVDSVHDILGGRNVRLPIGVAGFLHATGNVQIASGSVGGSAILSTAGLGVQYDARTGSYKGVRGSVKLRMPGPSKFAPSWTSKQYPGKYRGAIFENVDEYPMPGFVSWSTMEGEGLGRLQDIVGSVDYLLIRSKIEERQLKMLDYEMELGIWNMTAEAGSIIGTIAEGVSFVKSNFGMVMSAAAFISDPLSVTKAALGIGVGAGTQSRLSSRRFTPEQQQIMDRYGLKVSKDAGGTTGLGRYIGFTAWNTFSQMAENIAEGFTGPGDIQDVADIGDVYQSTPYTSPLETDKDYEATYGTNDYTPLAETHPEVPLEELYGDNDYAPEGSDLDPAALDEAYGAGYSSSSVRSPEDIARALEAAQSAAPPSDEDTSGIRGVADEDAVILPVI